MWESWCVRMKICPLGTPISINITIKHIKCRLIYRIIRINIFFAININQFPEAFRKLSAYSISNFNNPGSWGRISKPPRSSTVV